MIKIPISFVECLRFDVESRKTVFVLLSSIYSDFVSSSCSSDERSHYSKLLRNCNEEIEFLSYVSSSLQNIIDSRKDCGGN